MGFAGNTLDLIRTVFKRSSALPIGPSYFDSLKANAISYSNVTLGPQNGYNDYLTDSVKLDQDLMSRYADYEDMDDYPELGCIAGDSLVRTLEGPMRIADLAAKYKLGEIFKILAYDRQAKRFVVADAHSPRITKHGKVVEVQFDNGTVLRCTPDHKILTRTNAWKEAKDLVPGEAVMPLETRLRLDGYIKVCHPEQPDNERWEHLHRLIGRHMGDLTGMQVHHKDGDALNNSWENLELLTPEDHCRTHSPAGTEASRNLLWTEERRQKHADRLRGNNHAKGKLWSEERRKAITGRKFKMRRNERSLDEMLESVRSSYTLAEAASKLDLDWTTLNRRLARHGIEYKDELAKAGINHRVIRVVELNETMDVYDLTTEVHHNFIANGVVVHNSALDLYADDATVQDVLTGRSMWFEAEDLGVEGALEDLLMVNLKAEEHLWEIARSLCKYGNNFEELMVMDGRGVIKLNHLPPPSVRRIEDINGILYGFIQDPTMVFRMDTKTFLDRLKAKSQGELSPIPYDSNYHDLLQVFEPWEVVHFRLRGKSRKDLYGYSVMEPARWVWKRLTMLEDAMLLYKLTRSPQRYAYYVDVGDVPPNQARQYVNKIKNDFKKTKFIDPNTGKPSFRYNPLSMDEDIFVPVRKGKKATEIDVLSGPEGQQTDDAHYFLDKMFAALKIPKSYLGGDDTVGRNNLSQQDVRFARTVMRIQRELKNGYQQIARVDLSAKNIDPDRVVFDCHMVIPSGVFELAQMEVQTAKLDLAEKYKTANFSEYYIWSAILGLSDDEINDVQKQRAREGESNLDAEEAGMVRELMPKAVDRAGSTQDKAAMDLQHKIMDEIQTGNTKFGKRMQELKLLSNEIRQAVKNQKYYRGRR